MFTQPSKKQRRGLTKCYTKDFTTLNQLFSVQLGKHIKHFKPALKKLTQEARYNLSTKDGKMTT